MRVAAIDCGTNSIRLLIADNDDGVLTDVHREMRVVRLGQGVDATCRLTEEALARTFAATEDYAELIRTHGAQRVRFVATSATRDAQNRQVFIDGIRARLGVEPEVVSGDEEAALSFAGAASVLPGLGLPLALVVDLGGGSTEFVAGNSAGVQAGISTNMGCVRFTERYLLSDPPTAAEITAAEAEIEDNISAVLATVPLAEVDSLVGVAGSVTTITAQALNLPGYDRGQIHGAVLPAAQIIRACTDLLQMTRAQRQALPFMHPGRVDVIGAGALIWRTVVARLGVLTAGRVDSVTASEHDILDGIALGISRQD
ncbi:MAG: Ppx/GppA family phosphatase [Actinomycetota bacterium]|uniref:Ppx/GppA phosphatase family protein n=1 Tax=Paenarthrobacter sp. PH39-S1 TaxID=3046204 RepID=UPI0024BA728B|nr:Ppx/GppA phosphatase family protein [Paenarthrobacter sp. PH39-S1]MDJ0354734.1 Ppx/GppA phosphatase family protein [Paenarthrobacter sp. PH39-S1]MDQ6741165.1 Ppx/GppA family phosphatase [Actinomycetota bacterium]